VPAQVHGDYAVVVAEVRCEMVECARDPRDAVQQEQRLLNARPLLAIMDAKAVDGDLAV